MTFRMNWETSSERQKSMHFRSLPRIEGWAGGSISSKYCWSRNELKTSGKTLQEIGSELESGWLSLKASKMKSLRSKQDRTTPDEYCSSSHFEVGEPDCFVIAGQQARQCPVFPQAKHVPMLGQCGKNTIARGWLVGLSLGLGTWSRNRPRSGEDLLIAAIAEDFFFFRDDITTRARLSAL